MAPGPDSDVLHVELILERIAAIPNSVGGLAEQEFVGNKDQVELAAFRLANIGESTRQLSQELKSRHPQVAWEAIYRMRNILVHAYDRINPHIVWASLGTDLQLLEDVCADELDRSTR